MAGDGIDTPEEQGIEKRLPEETPAEAIPVREVGRELVVGQGIDNRQVARGIGAVLAEENQAHGQSQQEQEKAEASGGRSAIPGGIR